MFCSSVITKKKKFSSSDACSVAFFFADLNRVRITCNYLFNFEIHYYAACVNLLLILKYCDSFFEWFFGRSKDRYESVTRHDLQCIIKMIEANVTLNSSQFIQFNYCNCSIPSGIDELIFFFAEHFCITDEYEGFHRFNYLYILSEKCRHVIWEDG